MRVLSENPTADELREVKFKVTSEEESERVQNAVFVAGGEWGDGSTSAEHKDKMFLLVSDSLRITYTTNGGYFSEQHYEEVSLPEIATPPEVGALIDPPQLGECIGDTQDEQMYAWFDGASKINNYLADFTPVTHKEGECYCFCDKEGDAGFLSIGQLCPYLDNEHSWDLITESEMIEMAMNEDNARKATKVHPHHDLIAAKIANMDLVVLFKMKPSGQWERQVMGPQGVHFWADIEYFLCHEKHAGTVLHILNGGEGRANHGGGWMQCDCDHPTQWHAHWWYMNEKVESQIKPKKEKRWIVVHTGRTESLGGRAVNPCSHAFHNEEDAQNALLTSECQIIEIEVEVE